jgi:hypothetical protein
MSPVASLLKVKPFAFCWLFRWYELLLWAEALSLCSAALLFFLLFFKTVLVTGFMMVVFPCLLVSSTTSSSLTLFSFSLAAWIIYYFWNTGLEAKLDPFLWFLVAKVRFRSCLRDLELVFCLSALFTCSLSIDVFRISWNWRAESSSCLRWISCLFFSRTSWKK